MEFTIAEEFVRFKRFVKRKIAFLEEDKSHVKSHLEEIESKLSQFEQAINELHHRDEETIINAWFSNLPRDQENKIKDPDLPDNIF